MINRVLIRIKVVQMLYCYLLSQSEFKIAAAPTDGASRDNRYAYSLYMDLLMMILEMSGVKVRPKGHKSPLDAVAAHPKLERSAMGKALNRIDAVRAAILSEDAKDLERFDSILPKLYADLQQLPAFKSYVRKKKTELADDVEMWLSALENLVEKNKDFLTAARTDPNFTYTGFHRAVMMLGDMLRNYNDNRQLFIEARNSLDRSLDRARQLYVSLMELPIALTKAEEERLEANRNKYRPTDADLHPNLRFVENAFVRALSMNDSMTKALKGQHIDWDTQHLAVTEMLTRLQGSDLYKQYMAAPTDPTFEQDCTFWREALKTVILPGEALAQMLETESVYWNDDMQIVGEFVLKTLRRFATSEHSGQDIELLPAFSDKEVEAFGPKLFTTVIDNYDNYRVLIDEFLNQRDWTTERLAFMDVVIMVTAIAEMLTFPLIPIPVTMNEYIEIANAYSTPRSGGFINGVLASVIKKLREDGQLQGK